MTSRRRGPRTLRKDPSHGWSLSGWRRNIKEPDSQSLRSSVTCVPLSLWRVFPEPSSQVTPSQVSINHRPPSVLWTPSALMRNSSHLSDALLKQSQILFGATVPQIHVSSPISTQTAKLHKLEQSFTISHINHRERSNDFPVRPAPSQKGVHL